MKKIITKKYKKKNSTFLDYKKINFKGKKRRSKPFKTF